MTWYQNEYPEKLILVQKWARKVIPVKGS